MRYPIILFLLVILVSFHDKPKQMKVFLAGDSTMSIKDPKSFPETGWGMPFVYFWDSSVQVVNKARNGRSTRTFIAEGLWQSIVDNASPEDVVMIQFGHNDESPEKTDRYTAPEMYSQNLKKMIDETRQKKAVPVLITPVARRRFDARGNVLASHPVYSDTVKALALREQVCLIDLDGLSMDLYRELGKEYSRLLFLQLKPGEHPNYPEGKEDNTHFNELGARLIAQLVLKEIRSKLPALGVRNIVTKPKS